MALNAHMKITWITLATLSVHCCVVMAQTTFQKNYGTFNADACTDFVITADSGYAAVGYNVNIGAGSQDVCLIKTDKSGVLEWARNYGGVNQETASSVALTQDGGYILCGYTNSYGAGFDDIYVIRTDSVGGVVWAKVFGSPGSERGHEVIILFQIKPRKCISPIFNVDSSIGNWHFMVHNCPRDAGFTANARLVTRQSEQRHYTE